MTETLIPKDVRGVTFDLDGTLYLAKPVRRRFALKNLRSMRTVRVATAVRQELRGRAFEDGEAYFGEETRLIAERLQRPALQVREEVDQLLGPRLCDVLRKVGPVSQTHELLERLLAAGLVLGVVSDYAVEEKLEALGLADLEWRAKVACDAQGALKPDPRAFFRAAQQMGVPPEQLVHIGDRADTDGEGASAAGFAAVVISPGSAVSSLQSAIDSVVRAQAG